VQAIKLSEACDHYLWNFKREVTQKARFLEQATKICAGDIDKLRVCEARRYRYIDKTGVILSALVSVRIRIRIQRFTLMRIRIQGAELMRIRIQGAEPMLIRILVKGGSGG
jgi:hypothetical protein